MRTIPTFETERLVVRPFIPDDKGEIDFLFDNQATAQVKNDWLQWSILNYEQLARLDQPPYGDRAVCLKSGALVGSVGVVPYVAEFERLPSFGAHDPFLTQAEVGLFWSIVPVHQNRGYATEAAAGLIHQLFKLERLQKVIATTGKDNLASQAVMHKLGMEVEFNPEHEPPWLEVVAVLKNPEA